MGTATITILFCDLVDSTALHARIGDDAADQVRRRCFSAWSDAIAPHRGVEVKNQGDGLMVTFTSAADAIGAAVALQQATAGVDAAAGRPGLALRVGVSVGDVTEENGDWFGTPVHEAARLCAAAGRAQILVSDLARALAGSRGGHRFASIGELPLKGLPEPVAASEVSWKPVSLVGVPIPPALAFHDAAPFVGRADEMQTLRDEWRRAEKGERVLAFVSGEPGIGKTRLVAQLALWVHDGGGVVLYGGCSQDYGLPMQPVVECLHTFVATARPDVVREVFAEVALAAELTRVLPTLGSLVPDLPPPVVTEPETERYRLFEAICDLLAAMSRRAPVLLVVDDLHWAPRMQILMHLLRSPLPMRVFVVGTYRDTELGRTHPLAEVLADLRMDPGYQRVALHGLDASDVEALVAASGPAAAARAPELARAVHGETDGNPFFVGEVLRNFAETGSVGTGTIPEGIRQVIGQRVNRLPGAAGSLLSVAAIVGQEFDVGVLAEAAGVDPEDALDALAHAEQSQLVVSVSDRPGRYGFAHALVRSTLYAELPTAQRLRIHRRVARALERLGPDERLAELAYHYGECAVLGDADRAVEYARRAGDAARAALAFEQAASHFGHALAALELDDHADQLLRCDLLIWRGDALRRAGDELFAEVLREAAGVARAVGDGSRLGRAVLAGNPTGLSSATGDLDAGAVARIEEALALLGDGDPPIRARLLGSLAAELMWVADEQPRRRALCEEAAALALASGDNEALVAVLLAYHEALSSPANLDERIAIDAELLALGAGGNLEALFTGHRFMVEELVERGDLEGAREHFAAVEDAARTLRQPYVLWSVECMHAAFALLHGDLDGAARMADASLETAARAQVPDAVWSVVWATHQYIAHYEWGRLAQLEIAVGDAGPTFDYAYPFLLFETGRPEAARVWYQRKAACGFAELPRDVSWYFPAIVAARLAHAFDDRDGAEQLYALLVPYRERMAWFGIAALGATDQPLALLAACLGRDDVAHEHFVAANAICERMEARPALARTRVEWAEFLAARGEHDRAAELARAALDLATPMRMEQVAARARVLLS